MAEFSIRSAKPADVPSIVSLIRELAEYEQLSHQCKITVESLEEHLFGEKSTLESLVTEISNEIVGYSLFFNNFSSFTGKSGIFVDDIFVKPSHRRLGFGTAMLEQIIGLARERDSGRVEWVALDWNKPAANFYNEVFHAELMDHWKMWRITL